MNDADLSGLTLGELDRLEKRIQERRQELRLELRQQADFQGRRVLVIDDDRASRALIRAMLLGDLRYQVTESASGQEGLRMAKSVCPQIILLDIMMPDIDGLQVCQQLRSAPETAGSKIIMVTARKDDRMLQAGLASGADEYLTKPFTKADLLARIERVLAGG